MENDDKKPKKIVVSKRKKGKRDVIKKRKTRQEDTNENPLLSKPPSNSVGYNFLQKRNMEAKAQAERSELIRDRNGISVERDTRMLSNTKETSDVPNFVRTLINRFR